MEQTPLTVLLAVLSTTALVSLSVYIGLAYWGQSAMLYSTALRVGPSWRARIVLIFAAVGLLICLFQGARAMLFWLPPSWGTIDENGEYQTLAASLAALFTSGGLFLIAFIDTATHEKVWLRVTRAQVEGLSEILQASLDRRTLDYLEEKYQKKAADLAASLGSLPIGHSHEEHLRDRMGPTGERIRVVHELVAAVQEQRKRLEQARVP